jgi:S1-C subfamily serine protease
VDKERIGMERIMWRFRVFFLIFWACLIFMVASVKAEPLPGTVLKIKPSIVGVGTFMPARSPQNLFLGTGFVVANGQYIVTNAHVVAKRLESEKLEKWAIYVTQNNKPKLAYVNKIVVDEMHDIAILKLLKGRLPALKLAASQVREGKLYAFTGYPIGMILGLYPVTHRGIISAISPVAIPAYNSSKLNSNLIGRLRNPFHVYQLDATAYPGNSGSPLYDVETAEVIGVINKVFVKESKENVLSKPSGITYAIPIEHVKKLLISKGLY